MASRLLLAAIVGIAVAVALTRLVISYDYIRIWLINVPSLLVWGGAFLTGIVVAAIAPPTFEVSTPAVTMFAGSLIGIIAFGTGMNVSLADQTVLTYTDGPDLYPPNLDGLRALSPRALSPRRLAGRRRPELPGVKLPLHHAGIPPQRPQKP